MSTWTDVTNYIKTQLKPGVLGHTDVQKILNSILAVINQINTADFTPTPESLWKADVTYPANTAPVLWQDKWLVSNTANNLGNVPINTSGVVHPTWRVISASAGSGISEWESKVYPNTLEIVFVDGALYYLDREEVGAAPYVSVDFAEELLDGVWVSLGGMVPHNSLSGLNQGNYQHLTASELATVQGITRSLDAMGALIRYNFPSKVSGSAGEAASDFVTVAQVAAGLTNANNWDTAYGWGNHANAGYALLSDLGGYVTLNTNQTITGIKTFTNNIDLISAGGATGRLQSGTSAISLFTTSSADVSIGTNNLVRVIVGANGTTQFAGGIAVGGYTPSLSHAALFNGNVGIGINNPQAQLHINGSISTGQFLITRTDFAGSGFSINAGDGNTTFNSFLPANLGFAGYVFRSTQGTQTLERMRIMPNGNVGIGTSSTAEKLHVSGGNIIVNPGYSFGWGNRSAQIIGYAYDTGYLRFDTNDGERMRITASGQMIIGDTSMTYGNNQGYVAGFKGGSSSQTFISLAKVGQSLSSQGFMIGLDNAAAYLYNHDNTPMVFVNNAIERMRITSSGNLLIGTTTDNGLKLQVSGNASISGSGNSFNIFSNNNSLSLALGYQGVAHGYLGGISSRLEAYSSNGGYVFLNSSSVWVAASDKNRKRNFENYNLGLGAILKLQPKQYHMDFQKNDEVKQVGLIAQEVKEFIPDAYEENQKFIGLNYNSIIVTLINAIKDLKLEIDMIKN
jgi:hypothetical protein